jgi:hypothetical protein
MYDAIKNAKPLTGIRGFRRTANRQRHFEKLSRMPGGFVALGDAVCGFNPIYGQGMTLTCLGALELDKWLKESAGQPLNGLAYHKKIAKLVAAPFALATGEDLRWPATQGGEITAQVRFMHWYIDQIMALISGSPEIFKRFQLVNHMLAGPETLFHPAILMPVLRHAFTPAWGRFLPSLARGRQAKDAGAAAASNASTVSLHTQTRIR